MTSYQDKSAAESYIKFLNSPDGILQQDMLAEAILSHLSMSMDQKILDAGCGSGWLAGRLASGFGEVWGCDSSEQLLNIAKKEVKGVQFHTASLTAELPYDDNYFDVTILNMVAPDVDSLEAMFANIHQKLKPAGQLIMTVPNPFYTEPIAEWKRSLWDALTLRKPSLRMKNPYLHSTEIQRNLGGTKISSHFYTLANYFNSAHKAGFRLANFSELMSDTDSNTFNLRYRMHRYPLILLMKFTKP